APYPRLAVPWVHTRLSTGRLLVMDEVVGVPLREAPPGDARREAAKQLLGADGRIHLLDLGMTGTLDGDARELLLLLLLAFWRRDADFLADVLLMLGEARGELDLDALRRDLRTWIERFRVDAFSEIDLGPMLDEMIEIATRH